jgi:hypothetical protein
MGLLTRLDELLLSDNQLSGRVMPVELSSLSAFLGLKNVANNLITGSLDMSCNQTALLIQTWMQIVLVRTPFLECPCCTSCCDSLCLATVQSTEKLYIQWRCHGLRMRMVSTITNPVEWFAIAWTVVTAIEWYCNFALHGYTMPGSPAIKIELCTLSTSATSILATTTKLVLKATTPQLFNTQKDYFL